MRRVGFEWEHSGSLQLVFFPMLVLGMGSTVTLDHDMRVVGFEEKPTHPTGRVIGACIYILPFRSLRRTVEYLDQGGRSDEPGNFIAWLCKKVVYGFKLKERVWDIGSMEEYERTQREFAERR